MADSDDAPLRPGERVQTIVTYGGYIEVSRDGRHEHDWYGFKGPARHLDWGDLSSMSAREGEQIRLEAEVAEDPGGRLYLKNVRYVGAAGPDATPMRFPPSADPTPAPTPSAPPGHAPERNMQPDDPPEDDDPPPPRAAPAARAVEAPSRRPDTWALVDLGQTTTQDGEILVHGRLEGSGTTVEFLVAWLNPQPDGTVTKHTIFGVEPWAFARCRRIRIRAPSRRPGVLGERLEDTELETLEFW